MRINWEVVKPSLWTGALPGRCQRIGSKTLISGILCGAIYQ